MFRKKQKLPAQNARNVRQSERAPVFSYYANRSSADTIRERGEIAAERTSRLKLKQWLHNLPSILAASALLICLMYISTLSADANVQVVGQTTNANTLLADLDSYRDEFRDTLSSSPFNRSKLLIDTEGLAKELSARYPELGEISVVLPLVGRRPVFKVRPAEPAITLGAAGGPYVVDTKGRVLAYTRDTDSSITDKLPVVRDDSGLPVERGSAVITDSTIVFITSIVRQLEQAKVRPASLLLPQTNASELHVRIEGKPYYVKFDMRGQGRSQAGTFLAVKGHLEREGKTPGEYIDVRVPEKAFYK